MAGNYKGTGVVLLHKLFDQTDKKMKESFMASLTPIDLQEFKLITSTSWVPISLAARLIEKGVTLLYPNDPLTLALRKYGREQASDNLNGVYKILLLVVSIEMAITRSAQLWKTYFDQGIAHGEKMPKGQSNSYLFVVDNFPDLPLASREVAAGFIEGILALAKAVNYKVTPDYLTPNSWKWLITWD